MTAWDAVQNFAASFVATAPAPATSGLSLSVISGDGGLFPDPAVDGPFNCSCWPATVPPIAENAEIVRVTARAGDVFTIARAQEGAVAKAIGAGWRLANTVTAKNFTDIEDAVDVLNGSLGSLPTRDQVLRTGLGVITEPFRAVAASGTPTSPSSGFVYGVAVGLKAGDVVTGVRMRIETAAAGDSPSPSVVRFGLADATGKVLVRSGNLNASSNWHTGPASFPFSAPYTVLADGAYLPCLVVVGTWSSVAPLPLMGVIHSATSQTAAPGCAPESFTWTGQTDLPAVGSSLTMTLGSQRAYYLALY